VWLRAAWALPKTPPEALRGTTSAKASMAGTALKALLLRRMRSAPSDW
jgi:hypothetical protein